MWSKSPRDKLLAALFKSSPIEPKHTRPGSLTGGFGGGFFDSEQGDRFFADFEMYPDRLNTNYMPQDEWPGWPWRLQELKSTEISRTHDYPKFGRRYSVFYNQASIGLIELTPSYDYSSENNPKVYADIKLECARLLPFAHILGFLVSVLDDNKDPEVKRTIDLALLAVVWNASSDSDGAVELSVCCSFARYLQWMAWAKNPTRGT